MDIATMIQPILQLGISPVLLLIFVKYFFEKDKARDKAREAQISEINGQLEKREALLVADMNRREEQYKERERIITAENAQREDILKEEADKREKIIRDESEKREVSLMATIEGFRETFDKVNRSMEKIYAAMVQLQQKIDGMGKA